MSSPARIDIETSSVHRTIHIEAPRALVFAALTAPEQISQWLGQRADFPDGVHAGASGTFGWTDYDGLPVRIETYEEPSQFAFTWGAPGEEILEENSTTATFTLEDAGDGTQLTVVETGFDTLRGDLAKQRAAMEDNAQGWTGELDELVDHVRSLREGRSAVADLDAGTITRTVVVAADRERTWESLASPEAIGRWWGHPAVFPDGVRPGSLGTFEWVGHGLIPVRIDDVDAPTRFVLTWGELDEPTPGPTATQVTFTLTAAGDQTLLTVLETGFENREAAERRAAMEGNVEGWNAVLDSFVRYAEARA